MRFSSFTGRELLSDGSSEARSPHRRLNPLIGEWVLVSPSRSLRPWLGRQEATPAVPRPAYDPACYLCPGNTRANGARNDHYTGTFVFDNDFPAFQSQAPAEREALDEQVDEQV